MEFNTNDLLPEMPGDAKVWVYQADVELSSAQKTELQKEIMAFVSEWHAHGHELKTDFTILFDRFVILSVDERQALASGCSIDSSVRKMKEAGARLQIDFFDRSRIAYLKDKKISLVPFTELRSDFEKGVIDGDTLIFDNTVQTVSSLREKWIVPLKSSPASVLVS